jgi:glucuronate isomerase
MDKITERLKDADRFFENLEAYLTARSNSDFDVAAVYNRRLQEFLAKDIELAKTETNEQNPFYGIAIVGMSRSPVEHQKKILDAMLATVEKCKREIAAHWGRVKGTDAGDKIRMITFLRELLVKLGGSDPGAVQARKMVERYGCFNGAVDGPLAK